MTAPRTREPTKDNGEAEMTDYKPQQLDRKWQERWSTDRAFEVSVDASRPKYYCLEMFAYPSGHAHVGHVRNYIIGDMMARTKRMRGYNVLHPFGWDAFGLPAENAAIKSGTDPETSTLDNIAHMKGQLQRLGISYAWDREIATCLPDYYKFNQWIFLEDVRARPGVPAALDGQLVSGRQDGPRQRAGRSTAPAGAAGRRSSRATSSSGSSASRRTPTSCSSGLDTLSDWPEKVVVMQRNWIGRSEGARLKFPLAARRRATRASRSSRRASTRSTARRSCCSRRSTRWSIGSRPRVPIRPRSARRVARFRALDRVARLTGAIEKEGFDTGRTAINPFTGEGSADLGRQLRAGRVRYRRHHGRAGARPARLRVRAQVRAADQVVVAAGEATPDAADDDRSDVSNYGRLVDSGEYTGRSRRPSSRR